MQTNVTNIDKDNPDNSGNQKMKAYSLAMNADFDQWFILSEIGQNARTYDGYYLNAPAFSIGAGYRIGKWTPFLNYGQYHENANDPAYAPVNWKRPSLTLRYDPTASTAIKVQLERYLEINGTAFTGDSTVLRISFDWVF
jgi:predicted porin